jgi:hypothetical protein
MENSKKVAAEVLIPMEEEVFFGRIRAIMREELAALPKGAGRPSSLKVEGLMEKPIYSMDEVRRLFDNVSRSTIYEWIEEGLLKPKKMKGKLFFLWRDIEAGWATQREGNLKDKGIINEAKAGSLKREVI